jgi:hypothetical protein
MKWIGLLAGLMFLQPAFSQPAGQTTLLWKEDRLLRWEDYRAQPDPANPAAAVTATYLQVSFDYRAGVVHYTIHSGFVPERSWGRHKDDWILAHEQGHFDLAEIYARRLYRAFQQYRFNAKTFRQDLNRLYEHIMKEKDDAQRAYDRETDHSRNREEQEAWLKKIRGWLEETKPWQDYTSGQTGQQ